MKAALTAILVLLVVLMVQPVQVLAATVIIKCDVGGAQLEIYDDATRSYKPSILPKVLSVPRYTYIQIRVSAEGYETFERGYEAERSDINNILVSLIPDSYNPPTVPLFGMCGQIISRRGLQIIPGTYKVLCRNMTTFKKTDGSQVSQDINPNETNGGFSGVFANLANNRAAAAGDKIFIGVFNHSLTRCYGHVFKTLSEDEISNAGVFVNIFIK